ncbi:MAG: rhodanese-like domain-containing protein [Polaromonas sp.]|nr:rhodanese-like domain-containing protein [Polaromonas sp.]
MKHMLPQEAWALIQNNPGALFIDVRMAVESQYVGYPPGVINIAWYEFPDYKVDAAQFVAAVGQIANGRDQAVVLICRSGLRSVDAGMALEKAGFTQVINVLDGFEGEPDDNGHRSTECGWRFDGLPWTQT